jgi:hypothetical protein
MRHYKLLLAQVIVASICARLALFVFEVSFAFGDGPTGATPLGWEIALDAIIGVIFLIGVLDWDSLGVDSLGWCR